MKAQTKALVASVVVIALALSAVSGITYSWFSDTEQSKIDVSTAVVDFEPTYSLSSGTGTATSAIGTTLTMGTATDGVQSFTLSNLAANQQFTVISDIDNKSTVKTVYRMYATYEKTGNITNYDIQNISINGKYLTTDAGTSNKPSVIITNWTELAVGTNPTPTNITIATPTTYGSLNNDGTYYVLPGGSDSSFAKADWNAKTARSGLTINIVIQAYQGDYPYTAMTVSGDTATATLPENKVVKTTESITTSGGTVSNVIMDFSNAGKVTGTVDSSDYSADDVTGTKVTTKVESVDASNNKVTIDLSLYKISGTAEAQTEELISSPQFTNPVVITMTVPGALSDPKVVYNEDGTDGTVLSSTIDATSNTTTVVFSVTHFSNYTIKQDNGAESKWELQKALAAGGYVKLGDNVTDISPVEISKDTVLDLNGKTITFATGDEANIVVAEGAKLDVVGTTGSAITFYGQWGFKVLGELTISGDASFTDARTGETQKTGDYAMVGTAGEDAVMTINGGTFTAPNGGLGQAVYTLNGGKITINGGTFIDNRSSKSCGWLLNMNNDKIGNASITVYGGTFTNYDPSTGDDKSASSKTAKTFVADGYVSVLEEGNYVVHLLSPSYAEGHTVSDGITSYKTLKEALGGIHNKGLHTLWCKAEANVGEMTHGHVCSDLTIIGNGAYVSGGGGDFELDTYNTAAVGHNGSYLSGDVTLKVYNLNGCGAWGERHTEKRITLEFVDCKDMTRIIFKGQVGTIDATVTNCSFKWGQFNNTYADTAIKYDSVGTLTITNTSFENYVVGINMKNDGTEAQILRV